MAEAAAAGLEAAGPAAAVSQGSCSELCSGGQTADAKQCKHCLQMQQEFSLRWPLLL